MKIGIKIDFWNRSKQEIAEKFHNLFYFALFICFGMIIYNFIWGTKLNIVVFVFLGIVCYTIGESADKWLKKKQEIKN